LISPQRLLKDTSRICSSIDEGQPLNKFRELILFDVSGKHGLWMVTVMKFLFERHFSFLLLKALIAISSVLHPTYVLDISIISIQTTRSTP
jgi:hypothetical protein